MFGIKEKINDDALYLLNDMVENQVKNAKKELAELAPENKERIEFLTSQIKNYEAELDMFETSIRKQLKEKLQFKFGIELIYISDR